MTDINHREGYMPYEYQTPFLLPSIKQFVPPPYAPVYDYPMAAAPEKKKRPRRKHDEIERIYLCNHKNCTKGYGTLNHLNAHVLTQGHGEKRRPEEFKEIRAKLRERRKKSQELKRTQERSQERVYQSVPPQAPVPMYAFLPPPMGLVPVNSVVVPPAMPGISSANLGPVSAPASLSGPSTSHNIAAPIGGVYGDYEQDVYNFDHQEGYLSYPSYLE